MSAKPGNQDGCSDSKCGCNTGFTRRDFLRSTGFSSLALLATRLPVMAGPFGASDFEKLIPADKKLDPAWVKSLFERGAPEVYRGADLRFIGMPVGGICTGQLYLGGDGRLWHWDIFNRRIGTGDAHYAKPPRPEFPLEQRFALKLGERQIPLDAGGFSSVTFRGEYPVGVVQYQDSSVPVEVKLEAFSPFCPLNTLDSSLPATVLRFTVKNASSARVEGTLLGSLENAICLDHRQLQGTRRNRVTTSKGLTLLECSAEKSDQPQTNSQPDITFEDWSKGTYEGWTVEGKAFGSAPIKKTAVHSYQGDLGGDTDYVVNSHASAPGNDVGERDNATGKLTSRKFKIERDFLRFWIGGGNHRGKTGLNLLVDGKVVRTATGKDDNRMSQQSLSMHDFKGQEAWIEIVDAQTGPWGHTGVGRIVFSDKELLESKFEELPDFGTMGLGLLGEPAELNTGEKSAPLSEKLIGELGRTLKLDPGQFATVTFLVTWFFPNLKHIAKIHVQGREYSLRFASAAEVATYVADHYDRLAGDTFAWRDTWYDSTLPYWFLDRTFLNTSILASSTCYRFKDGRFWAYEGVGCCDGTCTHVWHYAQAMARLFPDLERVLRERTDFGVAMQPSGAIFFRAENNDFPAIDGQAGVILRTLREHEMSTDDAFLKRVWPQAKKAMQWLIDQDANGDGIIEGAQHNTLDTEWYGPVAWLSGLYLAALEASVVMANEVKDTAFAEECEAILRRGKAKIVADLFDGEFFRNIADPKRPDAVNSGTGCEIDQVMGQSWAFQLGLPHVFPEKETRSALKSLWRYNFTPDVGPYRAANKPGRWYAMAGEAGLLMCSFPRADWDYNKAKGEGKGIGVAMYFNECMNGFEHQVAGHMIWEGMLLEGMAIERALHDRYNGAKRNPWNEVECGDHYARSMASYGVFLAACGFEYFGPHAHIGFAPKLSSENFKCAFTGAEGWGSYRQHREAGSQVHEIALKHGQLRVKTLSFELAPKAHLAGTVVRVAGKTLPANASQNGARLKVTLTEPVQLQAGSMLEVRCAVSV